MSKITISSKDESDLKKDLASKHDVYSMRLMRYLSMPDLSREPGNPIKEIVARAFRVESLKNFDVIEIPEIIPVNIMFDLFNMPPGHPARSKSDTYYVDESHVLRTHDTVFWYYYLNDPEIKKRIENKEPIGAVCFGKVYRKDEIDRTHMNVFHQIGGLYLVPDGKMKLTPDDLKKVLSDIARATFGEAVNFRFYDHNFPYTDPS